MTESDSQAVLAGVFDGHSGAAAADYLTEHLYEAFSHHLDDDKLQATGEISGSPSLRPHLSFTGMLVHVLVSMWRYHLSRTLTVRMCAGGPEVAFLVLWS